MIENIPTPGSAKGRYAYLLSRGFDPDSIEAVEARASLLCSNIDASVRRHIGTAGGARMNSVHVAHLVGLLLAESGVQDTETIELLVRDTVGRAQCGPLTGREFIDQVRRDYEGEAQK